MPKYLDETGLAHFWGKINPRLNALENSIPTYAHRGYTHTNNTYAQDNSLAAFACANYAGYSGYELDVQTDVNGVVVCFHDSDVSTITNGSGAMAVNDYSSLRYKTKIGEVTTFPITTLFQALSFAHVNGMKVLIDGHYSDGAYTTAKVPVSDVMDVVEQSGINIEDVSLYEWERSDLDAAPQGVSVYETPDISEITQQYIDTLKSDMPNKSAANELGIRVQLTASTSDVVAAIALCKENGLKVMAITLSDNLPAVWPNDEVMSEIDGLIAEYPFTAIDDNASSYRRGTQIAVDSFNHYGSSTLTDILNNLPDHDSIRGAVGTDAQYTFIPELGTNIIPYGYTYQANKEYLDSPTIIMTRNPDQPYAFLAMMRSDGNQSNPLWLTKIGFKSLPTSYNSTMNRESSFQAFIEKGFSFVPNLEEFTCYITDTNFKTWFTSANEYNYWYGALVHAWKPIYLANASIWCAELYSRNPSKLHKIYAHYNGSTFGYANEF